MKKIVLYLLLLISLIGTALACSCIADDSIENKFNRSDEVFIGKVIDITENENIITGFNQFEIKMSLSKSYKGSIDKNKIIYTNKDSAACGYNFEENSSYLIYAYEYENELGTGLCSGTKEIKDANSDLEYLNTIIYSGVDRRDEPLTDKTLFERIIDFFRDLFSKKVEGELKVVDFETCVDSGNLIMESYPRQCSDGKNTYVEKIDETINSSNDSIDNETDELEKPVACTREYRPVCGEVQIQCIRAPCNPIKETFSNSCLAKASDANILYEGVCEN